MIELKDLIYYLIQTLGIIVTGIFSYLIVKVSRQSAKAAEESSKAIRATYELTEKLTKIQEEKHKEIALRYASLLTGELKHNYTVYTKRDGEGLSLEQLLEKSQSIGSYKFSRGSHPIKMAEWDDYKKQIIEMDPLLGERIGNIYRRFELLIRHSNIDQLDPVEFVGFSLKVEKLIDETKMAERI